MDRREFTALLGAGVLFPGELLAKATTQPRIADDNHIQYYPIYYMRTGSQDVYQLWQPGIIMGVVGWDSWWRSKRLIRTYSKSKLLYNCKEELRDAIMNAPAHGLIIDVGFGRPYNIIYTGLKPCLGQDWELTKKGFPLLLPVSDAESLVANGDLCRCQPYCTYEEYLKRNFLEKKV